MKTRWCVFLAGTLLLGAGAVYAGGTADKVKSGAKNSGKTVTRGATAVGKSGSKIYHKAAGGFYKLVAKNSKSQASKARHMRKAKSHFRKEDRKDAQSERAFKRAGRSADQVGK